MNDYTVESKDGNILVLWIERLSPEALEKISKIRKAGYELRASVYDRTVHGLIFTTIHDLPLTEEERKTLMEREETK